MQHSPDRQPKGPTTGPVRPVITWIPGMTPTRLGHAHPHAKEPAHQRPDHRRHRHPRSDPPSGKRPPALDQEQHFHANGPHYRTRPHRRTAGPGRPHLLQRRALWPDGSRRNGALAVGGSAGHVELSVQRRRDCPVEQKDRRTAPTRGRTSAQARGTHPECKHHPDLERDQVTR
jgi:hypothetical protein